MTRYPFATNHASLRSSLMTSWVSPSISTISRAALQKKSAKYEPIGTCRRNLNPLTCRSRSRNHTYHSTLVMLFRSSRARSTSGDRMPTESTALARNPMVVVNAETIELPTRARVAPRPWRDLPAGRGGKNALPDPPRGGEEERLPDPPHGGEEERPTGSPTRW